ncbi:hypothetical protein L917_12371 [Phytophthora nicotianae]|uniref:BZIP domain-containing protein n=1 Tax=Phytophthora nicotianae TaxID=4792 RepID=W2KW17_PHYNI|nr:hypothetical protein L917_12371 [Phytophthora nicotianae]
MSFSSVYPPAIGSLSGNIIGKVMQRVIPPHRYSTSCNPNQANKAEQTAQNRDISIVCSRFTLSSNTQTTAASTSLCSDKIVPRFEILLPNRERPAVIPITHHTDDRRRGYVSPDEVDENEAAIESRRKRIRLTQARYRQKLLDKPKRLELAIQQLKEQTQHLEYERNQIVGGLSSQKTVWIAAVEYLRIFQRGCKAPQGTNVVDMDILKALVASNVAFSGGIGLDVLIQHWRVLTQYFPDISIQLKSLHQITDESVVATTTTTITMSDASMKSAFPDLLNGTTASRIVTKLQGQRLELQGSVRLYWDNAISRVVSIQAQADMMTPLMQLLENVDDVSLVFAHALITPECNLELGN